MVNLKINLDELTRYKLNRAELEGYNDFGDWPNLTIKLAERGFNEEEIRKMLGLNYLRIYKEVVG